MNGRPKPGIFYTYLWLRKYDSIFPAGTPYYAGKGNGRRGFTNWSHNVPCPEDKERIIIQEWPSEEDSLVAEKFLIAYYGRVDLSTGCLRNLTDGGENPPSNKGKHHSIETIQKIRESNKGLKRSEETIRRIKEARSKQVNAGGGGPKTKEHIERLRIAQTGKKHSDESRKKMSIASASRTPETRIKLSISQKKRWECWRLAHGRDIKC